MIDKTILVLVPVEDCSQHRLARHVRDYLRVTINFERYLLQPLREIFSKVIVYDYVKRATEVGITGINREVIDIVKEQHPDYVLWQYAYDEFRNSTLDAMREEGSTVIGWSDDDEISFEKYSKWRIPHLDYCLTADVEAIPKYRELGARVVHAVPNTGIALDHDWSNTDEKYAVSFVGARYEYREKYINSLLQRNIPVQTFGSGWSRFLSFEEMIEVFSTSKINLNFSTDQYGHKQQVKGRIFEVCLAGGFLLSEYSQLYEEYYQKDKEIVFFRNIDEAVEKIEYYLSHDEERRAIARAGWEKATGSYTSLHMLERVFDEIENGAGNNEGQPAADSNQLKMPRPVRRRISNYYLNWGNAFSREDYRNLWQEAFKLAISYYPFNIRAWIYYIIGYLPFALRQKLLKFYLSFFNKRISDGA